jgi:hypothetical protein
MKHIFSKAQCLASFSIIVSLIALSNAASIKNIPDLSNDNDKRNELMDEGSKITDPEADWAVASLSHLINNDERELNDLKRVIRVILAGDGDSYLDDHELAKKSWKLPIKTLGWYAEKSSKSNTPQRMVSELTDLLDSFKSA